jgi:adenylylsulfate reductase subunit B
MKECHSGAISYFLGADIGGNGATLSVRDRGDILEWVFHRPDGTEKTIEVKRNESNKY